MPDRTDSQPSRQRLLAIGALIAVALMTGVAYAPALHGDFVWDDNTLVTDGFYDLFLAKYDGQGNLLWVRNTGTSNALDGRGVATDALGNAYVSGYFVGSAQFGEMTLTNYAFSDIFVAKYDPEGMAGIINIAYFRSFNPVACSSGRESGGRLPTSTRGPPSRDCSTSRTGATTSSRWPGLARAARPRSS
jgi:hypothetical protein